MRSIVCCTLRYPTVFEMLVCDGQIYVKINASAVIPPIGNLVVKYYSYAYPVTKELSTRRVAVYTAYGDRRILKSILKLPAKDLRRAPNELPFIRFGKHVVAPVVNRRNSKHYVRCTVICILMKIGCEFHGEHCVLYSDYRFISVKLVAGYKISKCLSLDDGDIRSIVSVRLARRGDPRRTACCFILILKFSVMYIGDIGICPFPKLTCKSIVKRSRIFSLDEYFLYPV